MKLPPLRSLPVFEAVMRLNSFSRAAEELNVSQSAVSHQIKTLEEFLGEALFERGGRHVSPTEQGKVFYEGISSALLQIERASAQLLGETDTRLRVAVFSSFSVRWLIPRLPDLQRMHPQLELALEMTSESPDLSDRVADCFITLDRDNRAFHYDLIYPERLFPVCSQRYWQQMQTVLQTDAFLSNSQMQQLTAEQVSQFPLLSTHSIYNEELGDWRNWFEAVNKALPGNARLHHFSHMLLALEAARHHQGIALTNDYMLNGETGDSDLIRLPAHTITTGDRFYLAYKHTRRNEPAIIAFRSWLIDQAIQSGLRSA